jgi:hypothetical protein
MCRTVENICVRTHHLGVQLVCVSIKYSSHTCVGLLWGFRVFFSARSRIYRYELN